MFDPEQQGTRAPTATPALHWVGLVAIVALAASIRALHIDQEALWTDEALTLVISNARLQDLLQGLDPTPFLYYSLHNLIFGANDHPATVRLLSLGTGIGVVAAVYAIGRAGIGPRAALASALTAGLSLPLVDFSQEARAYMLVLLWISLAVLGLVLWTLGNRKGLAIYVACATLAVYTHMIGLLWAFPATLTLLATSVSRGHRERRMVRVAALLLTFFAVPELVRAFTYARIGHFDWLSQARPIDVFATWIELILPAGRWTDGSKAADLASWQIIAAIGSIAFLAWRITSLKRELARWVRDHRELAMQLAVLLLMPLIIWMVGFIAKPVFMLRTTLPGAIGFALLFGVVVECERSLRSALLLVLCFATASAMSLALSGTVRSKSGWDGAARVLAANARSGDVVMMCPFWNAPALMAAAHPDVMPMRLLIPEEGGATEVERSLGGDARWARQFYHSFWVWTQLGRAPSSRTKVISVNRLWSITEACEGHERKELRQLTYGAVAKKIGTGKPSPVVSLYLYPSVTSIRVTTVTP